MASETKLLWDASCKLEGQEIYSGPGESGIQGRPDFFLVPQSSSIPHLGEVTTSENTAYGLQSAYNRARYARDVT